MCAKWKPKGLNPDFIAAKLEELRIESGPSTGGFSGDLFFEDFLSALQEIVSFKDKVPELEKNRIVHGASFAAANAGKITRAALIR